jgi:hypothetical protein
MAARTLGRSDHLVQQFFPAGDCCFRACGRTIEHGKVSHYTGTIRARHDVWPLSWPEYWPQVALPRVQARISSMMASRALRVDAKRCLAAASTAGGAVSGVPA